MHDFTPLTRRITLTNEKGDKRIEVNTVIDTGAAVSLILFDLVEKWEIDRDADVPKLRGAFEGGYTETIGKIVLFILIDGIRRPIEFLVVTRAQSKCIIGWPTISHLKLQLSHQGVLTHEKRIFGKRITESINLIKAFDENRQDIQVYNINVSEINPTSAIDLGQGIFEDAGSGLVYTTNEHKPRITHNFLASKDLVEVPTAKKPVNLTATRAAVAKAFDENKFGMDPRLPEEFRKRVRTLLLENCECISLSKNEVGNVPTWVDEFHQEFTVKDPVPCKVYPVNAIKSKFLGEEIQKLVDMKVLQVVKYRTITSNVLAVPKKDKELRMVSDLRVTNKVTKPANLILPRLDQVAQKLMGHRHYVSFDVQKAYWSVTVPKAQRKWFTIQCPQTHKVLEWVKMPMGAKNAASVFSHLLQIHLVGEMNETVTVYIDDCNYGINDIEDGIKILRKLLIRLRKLNLKIGINKIQLFATDLEAFGFHFNQSGMRPIGTRITALMELAIPTDKKLLHRGLASLNYFRNFIPGFSMKAAKMYELIGEKASYKQNIVNEEWPILIKAVSDVIQIQKPDYTKPFILSTDASEYGMGMVLTQATENNGRIIIGCNSQGLSKSEKLWAIAQKELYAIYKGLVTFEHILFNNVVIIETDNCAIYWLLKLRIGSVEINKRLPAVRHLLYISTFDFEIRHVSGQEPSFLLSDFLSRHNYELGPESKFVLGSTSKQPLVQLKAIINGKYDTVPVNMIQYGDSGVDNVLKAHKMGKSVEQIHKIIALAQEESKFCKRMMENPTPQYKVIDGVLFRTSVRGLLIVCPKFYTHKLMSHLHDDLHEGIRATIHKVNSYSIWMFRKYQHIQSYIQNCKVCDPAKSRPCLKATNRTVNKPWQPFDIVGVDLMNIGKNFVLVLVDHFSEFLICRLLKEGTSEEIKAALADIFCHYGVPHTLVQDNGSNLNSAVMIQFYENLGIYVSNSTAYNSRANTKSEYGINRLSSRLRIFGTENGNMQLNLYIITHKLNLEKRPERRHSAFEIMFARGNSWIMQLPELSRASYHAQEKNLKALFDSANEIRNEILGIMERRRKNLTAEPVQSKLKTGDYVRIKKMKVDTIKKGFRPFSETIWEVKSVNRFTNTCIVKEITEQGYQPRIRKIHKRFLRKVRAPIKTQDDDFEMAFTESNTLKNQVGDQPDSNDIRNKDNKTIQEKEKLEIKEIPKQKKGTKRGGQADKRNKKTRKALVTDYKKGAETVKKTHQMTLRRR